MQVLLVVTGLIRVKKYHPLLLNADRTIVGNALIISANLKIRKPYSKRMLNLCQIDSKNTTPGQEHF